MAARRRRQDEPERSLSADEGWVEWGGQRIWAVGFTAGGAPYGLTEEELAAAQERDAAHDIDESGPGWARARAILADLFSRWGEVDIGRVKKVGDGLAREVYAAWVEVAPDPEGRSGAYAVLLPRPRGQDPDLDERTLRQAKLLAALGGRSLPFRVPELVAVVGGRRGLALVERCVEGIDLDLRSGRQPGVRPWEIVGQLAAAVHACPIPAELRGGHATRRACCLAALQVFEDLPAEPVVREAYAWALEHLPPSEPATLLHGDLLGQNILLHPEQPPALLDWEFARRGDPAHDLAIVTRGVRQPFQIARGLERLLEAYRRHGGAEVSAAEVHVHELCLAAGWYRESLAGQQRGGHPPEQELARLAGILRRARAGG